MGQEFAIFFPTDCCKFPTELIVCAQNFSFAPKFSQNGGFGPKFSILWAITPLPFWCNAVCYISLLCHQFQYVWHR